jgi:hypothetical protein
MQEVDDDHALVLFHEEDEMLARPSKPQGFGRLQIREDTTVSRPRHA